MVFLLFCRGGVRVVYTIRFSAAPILLPIHEKPPTTAKIRLRLQSARFHRSTSHRITCHHNTSHRSTSHQNTIHHHLNTESQSWMAQRKSQACDDTTQSCRSRLSSSYQSWHLYRSLSVLILVVFATEKGTSSQTTKRPRDIKSPRSEASFVEMKFSERRLLSVRPCVSVHPFVPL